MACVALLKALNTSGQGDCGTQHKTRQTIHHETDMLK